MLLPGHSAPLLRDAYFLLTFSYKDYMQSFNSSCTVPCETCFLSSYISVSEARLWIHDNENTIGKAPTEVQR